MRSIGRPFQGMLEVYAFVFLVLTGTCKIPDSAFVAAWVPKAIVSRNNYEKTISYNMPAMANGNEVKTALSSSTASSSATNIDLNVLESSISQLKRVLEREYISFFNPMERDYYSDTVTFIDPLTQLTGIDSYQNNVDMLSGRTLLGSLLFRDARIILHSVTGGQVSKETSNNVRIENIVTRWTLRFTFQILPWAPSPSFSGISVYSVEVGGPKNVRIVQQNDYWDSINLQPGGTYKAVTNDVALKHFLSLVLPSNFKAVSAGPELPFTTLRLASDYEVRRYPSYIAMQMVYDRRDEAYMSMSSYTKDLNPLAPAIIQVNTTATTTAKAMMWPLQYALPGETLDLQDASLRGAIPEDAAEDVSLVVVPESVVAVRSFGDAIVEPLVRKVDGQLRASLVRDGLLPSDETASSLTFAQYDAVYSMGERRSEVHIRLIDGTHPW